MPEEWKRTPELGSLMVKIAGHENCPFEFEDYLSSGALVSPEVAEQIHYIFELRKGNLDHPVENLKQITLTP